MNNKLERVQIVGLHGNKTVDVQLSDNTLILVGENGSGKTTILRILFDFLSGRWLSLREFQFDYVSATIDGEEHKVTRQELIKKNPESYRQFLSGLPAPIRYRVSDLLDAGRFDDIPNELKKMYNRYGYSISRDELESALMNYSVIYNSLFIEEKPDGPKKDLRKSIQRVRDAIYAQILYLPTYRRIERELDSIFEGLDIDDYRRQKSMRQRHRMTDMSNEKAEAYIELVEFGMKDVQVAIDRTLTHLKEFSRENLNALTVQYLGDVVSEAYLNVVMSEIYNVPETTVLAALNRIDERILGSDHKDHLLEVIHSAGSEKSPTDHSKIISHYFLKLLKFQESLQEEEEKISRFCALCSEYIVDKQFVYDSANFSFSIVPKDKNNTVSIELQDLSSGEKQIVSIFSHLYLSRMTNFFVLIDEPELSLSVPWQRRFLVDIKNGDFCAGLVAVTHSPFIYENDLRKYAHSVGEFVST